MIRTPLVLTLLMLSANASAEGGDPFTPESAFPIGVSVENKFFTAVQTDQKGAVTTYTPVAYAAPKWKKSRRLRARGWSIDRTDDETATASAEKASKWTAKASETFKDSGAMEAEPIRGGFTGRYRIPEMGMVVYTEGDQVLARTGDISVMVTLEVVPSLRKLGGKCKGTATQKILHVAANAEWKAVAVLVEATCKPDDAEKATRVQTRLAVKDVSKLVEASK